MAIVVGAGKVGRAKRSNVRSGGAAKAKALPAVGSIYAFRTSSLFGKEDNTGRYGAFKVLAIGDGMMVLGVLDGIWRELPDLNATRSLGLIHQERFAHVRSFSSFPAGRVGAFSFVVDWWAPQELEDASLLGVVDLSNLEVKVGGDMMRGGPGTTISTIHLASSIAEGEWRWRNDRAAYEIELAEYGERQEAKRRAEEERFRTRLKDLTWEKLLGETPFARWTESPPFPGGSSLMRRGRRCIGPAASCRPLDRSRPRPRFELSCGSAWNGSTPRIGRPAKSSRPKSARIS